MLKNFNKFSYPVLSRDESTGKRMYKTPSGDLVPSVTTILDKTKDKKKLDEWRARVGNDVANKVVLEAQTIGTRMHSHLEKHILGNIFENTEYDIAYEMANVIIDKGLKYLEEVWKAEVPLYYKNQYAGTTDLVGIYKGKPCIIDFKQTNKPKKSEWITDYYLQLCAYAHAHNSMHNTDIENGVVLMCSRDLTFQIFEVSELQFPKYSYMWFNRVNRYNELSNSKPNTD